MDIPDDESEFGVGKVYKLLKLAGTGLFTLIVGIIQVSSGESRDIVAGSGALLVSAIVFVMVGWVLFRKRKAPASDGVRPTDQKTKGKLLWLGIFLVLLPGLMYLYLRYTMLDFKSDAVVFVSIPSLIAGLGCLVASVWPSRRQ